MMIHNRSFYSMSLNSNQIKHVSLKTSILMTVQATTLNHEIILASDFSPKRTVLIPVDGSKNSAHALDHAIKSLLNAENDLVVLLHARTMATFAAALAMNYHEFAKSEYKQSVTLLESLAEKLKSNGYHVKAISTAGDARDVIDDQIELSKPDLVVVASHGQGALEKAFVGSVSQHVLRHSKAPVVVIPLH
ncbi:hypothetical protein BC833DRAFT_601835 [Globomyces pollinis-pini]|nr:hypothetical protein BC833DRAFT_601835 [Globomyces pollinis-pini]